MLCDTELKNYLSKEQIIININESTSVEFLEVLSYSMSYQVPVKYGDLVDYMPKEYIEIFRTCFNCIINIPDFKFPLDIIKKSTSKILDSKVNEYEVFANGFAMFKVSNNQIIFDTWKVKCYL
jgi:hypothetical protein